MVSSHWPWGGLEQDCWQLWASKDFFMVFHNLSISTISQLLTSFFMALKTMLAPVQMSSGYPSLKNLVDICSPWVYFVNSVGICTHEFKPITVASGNSTRGHKVKEWYLTCTNKMKSVLGSRTTITRGGLLTLTDWLYDSGVFSALASSFSK
jgi:hypothetical protein